MGRPDAEESALDTLEWKPVNQRRLADWRKFREFELPLLPIVDQGYGVRFPFHFVY